MLSGINHQTFEKRSRIIKWQWKAHWNEKKSQRCGDLKSKTINNTQLHPWMERVLLFKKVFLPTYYFQYHPHHRYTCICHLDTGRICKCPKSSWQNGKVFERCRNSLSTSGSLMIIYNYIHISIKTSLLSIYSIYKHHIYISHIHKNRQLVDPSRWPIASSEGVRATVANGGDVVFASGWRSGRSDWMGIWWGL